MAREEQDREDLLAEARALVERAEWHVEGWNETLVVGFRRDGGASFYFGADPAFHFNPQGQLRRAFIDEALVKAERGRLVRLDRRRQGGEVQLVRDELDDERQQQLLHDLGERFERLAEALSQQRFTTVGQVPPTVDLAARVLAWLAELPRPILVATTPRAAG